MPKARHNAAAILLAALALCAAVAECSQERAPVGDRRGGGDPLRIVYFHSYKCDSCREVKSRLPDLLEEFGGRVTVELKDVWDAEDFAEVSAYEEHYGVAFQGPPWMFVGDTYVHGEGEIIDRLPAIVRAQLAAGKRTFDPDRPAGSETQPAGATTRPGAGGVPEPVLERFRHMQALGVAAAGLLDGVNPCAFTTMVFLISALSFMGKSRRQVAVVGAGFVAAVFVTYLLLGVGVMQVLKGFLVASGVSRVVAIAVGVAALALAAWSVIDAVRYARTGSARSMTLGMPKRVKDRVHKVIRSGLSTSNLLIGAFGVGVLVALLESVCTGQVYLPTIVLVSESPEMRPRAIAYLVLYNVMFILPLVVVFALAYFGVSSERLGAFLRRHLLALKLAMAALFLGLGAAVLWTAV